MNGYSVNANVVVPIPGAPHPVAVAPLPCFRARFPVFSSEGLSVPTYKPTTNTSTSTISIQYTIYIKCVFKPSLSTNTKVNSINNF